MGDRLTQLRWLPVRLVALSVLSWSLLAGTNQAQYPHPMIEDAGNETIGGYFFGNGSTPEFDDFFTQPALDLPSPQRSRSILGIDLGVIALARSAPDPQSLAFDQNANLLLNADQLGGEMGAGLDATFDFYNLFSDCAPVDVELRFFQTADMSATETLTATTVTPIFFQGVPATPVGSYDVIYETNVRSFESNLVYRTPYRLRFLVGYRFLEVDEVFDINDNVNSTSSVTSGFFSIAENTMHGGHVGAEATLLSNQFSRLFGSFKWGLLNNDVVGSAQASNAGGSPIQADARDSVTSQLLDFQLGTSIGFSRWFSLYAGYQGLVVSDLALALEQSRNASVFGNSNPVFYSDTQFHGFKISGTATW